MPLPRLCTSAVTAILPAPLRRAAVTVVGWPVECQQVSRRNAMIAATVLAQRRAEREDVEQYLAGLHPGTRAGPAEAAAARVARG